MAYDFPNAPSDGQLYPISPGIGITQYQWSATEGQWKTLGVVNQVSGYVPETGRTASAKMPTGTSAQRDGTPIKGYTRFNEGLNCLEVYDGSSWRCLQFPSVPFLPPSAGALIVLNGQTVTLNLGSYLYDSVDVQAGGTLVFDTVYTYFQCLGNFNVDGDIQLVSRAFGGQDSGGGTATANPGITFSSQPGAGIGAGTEGFSGTVHTPLLQPHGSGGGSGAINIVSNQGRAGRGGAGGSGLEIFCDTFTMGATGTIAANGVDGTIFSITGASYITGSSGGSGGYIHVDAKTSITTTAGSSISVNGGNGSTGGNSTTTNLAFGGGGGGGGIIQFDSPVVTNNSTLSATGGANGNNSGAGLQGTSFGVGGASFGGKGGYIFNDGGVVANELSTNGYLILNGVIAAL